jgi:hypothetical protein
MTTPITSFATTPGSWYANADNDLLFHVAHAEGLEAEVVAYHVMWPRREYDEELLGIDDYDYACEPLFTVADRTDHHTVFGTPAGEGLEEISPLVLSEAILIAHDLVQRAILQLPIARKIGYLPDYEAVKEYGVHQLPTKAGIRVLPASTDNWPSDNLDEAVSLLTNEQHGYGEDA